jgi:hypothetical protein
VRALFPCLAFAALLASALPCGAKAAQDANVPGQSAAAEAPVVTVLATPSTQEPTLGETFTIELKALGPPGTTYRFASGASEEEIELRTPEPDPQASPGAALEPGTHRYEAAVYALGEVEIGPIPVRYTLPDGTEGEVETAPLSFEVGSLLPRGGEEPKLADIKGPQTVGIGPLFWVVLAVALVLLSGLVIWLVRRRRKDKSPHALPEPVTPADVEALEALDRLAASGLLDAQAYREFYIRLTTIAKHYLERRLGSPVLEMTTAETLAFLRDHQHGGELLPVVRDLAQAADQIKFARGQGLTEAAEGHLAAVRALVPALEIRLRPKEPENLQGGKAA